MVTRTKAPAKYTSASNTAQLVEKITESVNQLARNEKIKNFDIKVNKKSGLVRLNAQNVDGRTMTRTYLGPGLEETVTYDPSKNSKDERDHNIRTLLANGLTQAEVALKLGVSQALVSNVHRSDD
ncbi:hypothetical protein ACEN9F_15845 [Duganella sp. CT11-25]|uniref:hypothetical protein n=1 Tax=unclassified Duganella TaxID=2636909 RepID=UPI0039AEA590